MVGEAYLKIYILAKCRLFSCRWCFFLAALLCPVFLALEFFVAVLPYTRSRSTAALLYTTSADHKALGALGIGPCFVLRQLSRNVNVVVLDRIVRDLLKVLANRRNSILEDDTAV